MTFIVKYSCPHCGRRIPHRPEFAGQSVICSACGGMFIEPTDPQPGKEAERMPKPLPENMPDAYQSRDYSLALMSNTPGSGMQTMQEVFDAQVIDDKPSPAPATKTDAFAWPPSKSLPSKSPPAMSPPAPTPSIKSPQQPLVPNRPLPPISAPSAIPAANRPNAALPAAPKASPVAKAPIPAAGLAGITPQQMLDELGRRGLVCVLLVHDYSEEQSAQIKHTQHLNSTQAISLLAEFLLKSEQAGASEESKAGMLAAVKRLWSGDEDFLQAAGRLWNKTEGAGNTHPT